MITSSVDNISLFFAKIIFVVAEIFFKVTVMASLAVEITFVRTEISF